MDELANLSCQVTWALVMQGCQSGIKSFLKVLWRQSLCPRGEWRWQMMWQQHVISAGGSGRDSSHVKKPLGKVICLPHHSCSQSPQLRKWPHILRRERKAGFNSYLSIDMFSPRRYSMGPRWISQIRANVQICWHIWSPYVNVPWFGFGGPPDEDADVVWVKSHWPEYSGLSGRILDCFTLQLCSMKWDKDSLLDQFYSGLSEFSSQVRLTF